MNKDIPRPDLVPLDRLLSPIHGKPPAHPVRNPPMHHLPPRAQNHAEGSSFSTPHGPAAVPTPTPHHPSHVEWADDHMNGDKKRAHVHGGEHTNHQRHKKSKKMHQSHHGGSVHPPQGMNRPETGDGSKNKRHNIKMVVNHQPTAANGSSHALPMKGMRGGTTHSHGHFYALHAAHAAAYAYARDEYDDNTGLLEDIKSELGRGVASGALGSLADSHSNTVNLSSPESFAIPPQQVFKTNTGLEPVVRSSRPTPTAAAAAAATRAATTPAAPASTKVKEEKEEMSTAVVEDPYHSTVIEDPFHFLDDSSEGPPTSGIDNIMDSSGKPGGGNEAKEKKKAKASASSSSVKKTSSSSSSAVLEKEVRMVQRGLKKLLDREKPWIEKLNKFMVKLKNRMGKVEEEWKEKEKRVESAMEKMDEKWKAVQREWKNDSGDWKEDVRHDAELKISSLERKLEQRERDLAPRLEEKCMDLIRENNKEWGAREAKMREEMVAREAKLREDMARERDEELKRREAEELKRQEEARERATEAANKKDEEVVAALKCMEDNMRTLMAEVEELRSEERSGIRNRRFATGYQLGWDLAVGTMQRENEHALRNAYENGYKVAQRRVEELFGNGPPPMAEEVPTALVLSSTGVGGENSAPNEMPSLTDIGAPSIKLAQDRDLTTSTVWPPTPTGNPFREITHAQVHRIKAEHDEEEQAGNVLKGSLKRSRGKN